MRLFAIALTIALTAGAAHAAPTDLCESAVERAASKFMACRLDAESKHTRTLDSVKRDQAMAKCAEKFAQAVASAKSRNGTENCTTVPDVDLRTYMTDCSDGIEGASGLAGVLPTCSGDLLTCSTDLAACTGSLGACEGDKTTCQTNLATTQGNLATCSTGKTACEGSLSTCQTSLTTAQGSLSTCTTEKTSCQGSLSTCQTSLGATQGSLSTCSGNLSTCQTSLTSAQGSLSTCTTDKAACEGNLATAQAGTAISEEVLAGKTFASASGLSSTGSMSNRGAVTITPGVTDQTIEAGYHSGLGKVAGDPDLVAGNIVSGVSLFGVTGTATTGVTITNGLLKTGQTTSYGAGSDGAVQAGTAAKSFTDNGNGTVTDNRTGLVWAKKSDDGSIHDKDNTYTWGQTTSPYSMNGTMVTTYLAALNTPPCFANACDWRIPNMTELLSLVNYETFDPATFSAFNIACTPGCTVLTCSCMRTVTYWTSSTRRHRADLAWQVDFSSGGDGPGSLKTYSGDVRAVRGGL